MRSATIYSHFFFSSRRRHTRLQGDWSSDVCSSDLAQFLDCGGFSNAYRSGIRHGGAFDLKQATWAYRNALADARDPEVKAALAAQDIQAWFRRMPWHKGDSPISAAPEYEDYLFEQWSHGVFDDYWQQPGIYAEGFTTAMPMCRSCICRAG